MDTVLTPDGGMLWRGQGAAFAAAVRLVKDRPWLDLRGHVIEFDSDGDPEEAVVDDDMMRAIRSSADVPEWLVESVGALWRRGIRMAPIRTADGTLAVAYGREFAATAPVPDAAVDADGLIDALVAHAGTRSFIRAIEAPTMFGSVTRLRCSLCMKVSAAVERGNAESIKRVGLHFAQVHRQCASRHLAAELAEASRVRSEPVEPDDE